MPRKAPSPADAAYERVRQIGLGFPSTEEKLSHGAPSFFVRGGKMFLTFVDDHHGDGHVAVWCKSTLAEQKRLVAENPARFYVPPYVGVSGWVGVNVDEKNADWIELTMLVEEAWRSVAPARVQRGGAPPPGKLPPPPRRNQTDAGVAREAMTRFTALCSALPEVEVEKEGRHATYRVKKKVFAYFLDNHHGDGVVGGCVRGDRRANARTIEADPKRYFSPAYVGPRGYLGVRLDLARVDWKGLARRVEAAYRSVAPKALVARLP